MFDLPAAKRVRRADLYSPPSSPDPSTADEELIALLQSQLERVYGPPSNNRFSPLPPEQDTACDEPAELAGKLKGATEEGFEFRLFAGPRSAVHAAHAAADPAPRIILDDDDAALEGGVHRRGGFLVPRRDERYYFTGAVSPERRAARRKEFEAAAVSGEQVRWWLGVRYWGCQVRWRARALRDGRLVAAEDESKGAVAAPLAAGLDSSCRDGAGQGRGRRKGKPGKKRRVVLRMRKRKGEEAAEKRRREAQRKRRHEREREEADREKRTRRNREKKVKRRKKDRERKAGATERIGDGDGDDGAQE